MQAVKKTKKGLKPHSNEWPTLKTDHTATAFVNCFFKVKKCACK